MTAPLVQGVAEAEKAALAFQIALAKIGVTTIQAALALWKRVPANKAAQTAEAWLDDAVQMVMQRRALSRDLAMAYYRLARALRTGTTVPDPYDPIPSTVRLGDLRSEFQRLITEVNTPGDANPTDVPPVRQRDGADDETEIPIEEVDGLDENGDAEEAQLEREAEQEARIVLEILGPKNLDKRVNEIDNSRPATEVDELRDEAHAKAGSRQAAAADRIVKNGARKTLRSLEDRDRRVIGYVRVSRTGTPCGWCAMLISRGFVPTRAGNVIYDRKFPAEFKTANAPSVKRGEAKVGDQYHDNCNCYAEPVYSEGQLKSSMFDLNREYAQLWPRVTAGKAGKAALTAWRLYFRKQQKDDTSDPGQAQVA